MTTEKIEQTLNEIKEVMEKKNYLICGYCDAYTVVSVSMSLSDTLKGLLNIVNNLVNTTPAFSNKEIKNIIIKMLIEEWEISKEELLKVIEAKEE